MLCLVGDIKESRGLAEASFSMCAKVINVVCPTKNVDTIPEVFDVASEELSSVKLQAEDSTPSDLCMAQLVCLPEGNFQCTDVTTCSETVTAVLQKARAAILVFLLPIVDLLGKNGSWVSDLRTVILNSGIRCQLTLSSTMKTSKTTNKLRVVFTTQGGLSDVRPVFVTKLRRSLRDQLGLRLLNHELWYWSKASKILPLTEPRHCTLLEILKNSAGRQLSDCEWMELENMVLKKKCSGAEIENHQEMLNIARRNYTNIQAAFDHMQRFGLLLYFPPGDELEEETKETKLSSKHPGSVTRSTNSCDSGYSQLLTGVHHSLPSTFLVLHPSNFSSHVIKLSDVCHGIDMELNGSLIPIARRHGLLPKSRILEEELAKFPAGFGHAVHWSGILIDPARCHNIVCTETLPISSQGPTDTELEQLCLFPAALQLNKLPPLHNYTAIRRLAYRQPGVMQMDIPLIVFYLLIGHLIRYLAKVLSCGKHGFRFLVDLSHVLDVEYKAYYVQIAVHATDQKFDSSITAQICKSVKARITTCLKYVVEISGSYQGLSLEPSVLLFDDINSPDIRVDFVDLSDSVPSTSNTFVSVGGLEVKLSDDILYWYGSPDQVCSLINYIDLRDWGEE